jgi:hypothetical protein
MLQPRLRSTHSVGVRAGRWKPLQGHQAPLAVAKPYQGRVIAIDEGDAHQIGGKRPT